METKIGAPPRSFDMVGTCLEVEALEHSAHAPTRVLHPLPKQTMWRSPARHEDSLMRDQR